MPLPAGTRLGRYELRSQIGAGGMGEVYLAWDTELERQVALKVLPPDVASDRQRMNRFIQEAKAASALNHPNILSIYDAGEADSTRFIVTEYVEGETLRQHLSAGRMDVREALSVASQVASALAEAHAAGIVHRDIKPENVMLRRGGIVKVLDFGIAKLAERRPLTADTEAPTRALINTGPGAVIGTVSYMSPEQARGLAVDERTDIWSLGVVLYETVAGQLPFEGQTATDVLAVILHREPQPLRLRREDVPSELERIVEKALAKDREERYQTAKDLAVDLRRLRQRLDVEAEIERSVTPDRGGEGMRAADGRHAAATDRLATAKTGDGIHSTSSAEYIVTGIRRHKRAALVTLAAPLLATFAVGYFAYSRYFARGSEGVRSVAVLPFQNAGGEPETEYLSDGISESLINSLSQLPGVRVMARSTMFSFKGKGADPRAVGEQLGVEAVLTGRVVQRGDSLTVQADLVNVSDGSQMWGERYNRRLTDMLAVQDEIVRDVSRNLRAKLSPAQELSLSKGYTQNPEAYRLYLTGRHLLNNGTPEGMRGSIQYFQQAANLAPRFALANAGLADAYTLMGTTVTATARPREVMPKAREAAQRALELDSGLSEAHTSLAWVKYRFDWDWRGAEEGFKRAIELNPNNAQARHWYSDYLIAMGRFDESLAEAERARELDPLSIFANWNVGQVLYHARRYDEALAELRKALELNENFARTHAYLGRIYQQKGMDDEALAAYLKFSALTGVSPERIAALKSAYKSGGLKAVWRRELGWALEDSKSRHVSPFVIAWFYSRVGDEDGALTWLNKSVEERDGTVVYLKVDHRWDFIRSDPRFADLVRRVGLPQ